MENQRQVKDYWQLTSNRFRFFSCFVYIAMVIMLLSYLILWLTGYIKMFNDIPNPIEFFISWVVGIITSTALYILYRLFKKHDKNAVIAGYLFLSLLTIFSIFPNLSILGLLFSAYLFYFVYKTSKMQVTIS